MAYAAVTSLMGTLNLHFLQTQPRLPFEDKQEMVSLHENLGLLQEILEKPEMANDDGEMKDLEAEMRDVLFTAEENIEMELSSIYLQSCSKKACLFRIHGIVNQAVKQTDYLKKKLITIQSKYHLAEGKGSSQNERITDVSLLGSASSSSQPDRQHENITVSKFSETTSNFDCRMVGCDEEFMTILDQLTRHSAMQRQVIAILGMGGIGKTTLARKVYKDSTITSHFDVQAWITVSQEYSMEEMLRCLICCVSESCGELHDQDQLAERLYKSFKGRRYLIVIDDIWSTIAWDSVQRCFPDDNNGSRILLTSRLKEVAEYASSGNSPLNMRFLDADESWNLYCQVFGKTEFYFVFEQIGRDIVKKCKGLPLAIIVVASLLSKTEEKVEKWENVAENLSRLVIGDSNEACSRILSLSYNQLPHHLKACFLYFGVFPEDFEIPVKKLIRLWAAEGFLKAVNHRNIEVVGMECLQDLVDRSLVLVSKQSYNGKIKTIRIHDILHDLCLREAQCENLLNVVVGNSYHDTADGLKELPFDKRISCRWMRIRQGRSDNLLMSNFFDKFHSLHCCVDYLKFKVFSHFKLLRVVEMEIKFWKYGYVLATLVHLRYLDLTTAACHGTLDLKHFELCNIQSLIVDGSGRLDSSEASGIWKMPLLRNLHVDLILSLETSEVVHRQLETISWLDPMCCTKGLFKRIPNLKKLGIQGKLSSKSSNCFRDFVHLGVLEKLSIRDWNLKRIRCKGIQWATTFLPNLKKLNLINTGLPWKHMSLIGMLPNLEVLKLINACEGQKWEPSEGGFRRLKRLVIGETDLKYWNATGDHFPVLECLELSVCYLLKEIPSSFADITTLALIQLNKCWDSLLASAKWIRDEQYIYGNHAFLLDYKVIWESSYFLTISGMKELVIGVLGWEFDECFHFP